MISSQLLAAISQTFSSVQRERLSVIRRQEKDQMGMDGRKEGRQGEKISRHLLSIIAEDTLAFLSSEIYLLSGYSPIAQP